MHLVNTVTVFMQSSYQNLGTHWLEVRQNHTSVMILCTEKHNVTGQNLQGLYAQ